MTDLTREQIEAVCEALGREAENADNAGYDEFADILSDALTAIRQLQRGWMGIESAPKDGTPFLAYVAPHIEYVVFGRDGDCLICNTYAPIIVHPTAWMPLPLPPAGDA